LSPCHRRGAAAVELAVLLPFIVMAFLVSLDFCRVFYCTQTLQGCAEAGALYASGTALPPANTTASASATQAALAEGSMLNPALTSANVTVNVNGNTATVTVSYSFQTLVPYPGLSRTLTLTRTATMIVVPAVGATNSGSDNN
jgi:Flp pilus assembly protein TadG